jgi:tetratricopeptide (TPR) repeat protein
MPDEEPKEKRDAQPTPAGDMRSSHGGERSRRIPLTPEQRRFLGPGRSLQEQSALPDALGESTSPENNERTTAQSRPERIQKTTKRSRASQKPSRTLDKQNVALVIGGFVLLALTFYVGKKYEYWKYAIASRSKAQLLATEANKFPGISAQELVDQALVAEALGNWQEATERYIVAKYKNLLYSGILFRAGKLYYDHAGFDEADKLFERSIAFGENIDSANYYRGMIALGRQDFPAAERFFEAATNAAPFNADYFYSWAEALRKDRHFKEAIARYGQAALRATEHEGIVCRFKARMATVEAGDVEQLSAELEKKRAEAPLSVDWLMTAAVLQIHAGNIEEAVRLVEQARASDQSHFFGLFAACAGDRLFRNAGQDHPELAQACRVEAAAEPTHR